MLIDKSKGLLDCSEFPQTIELLWHKDMGYTSKAFLLWSKTNEKSNKSSYFLSRIIQRSEANGFSDSPGMLCSIFICFHVTWGKNTFLFVTVCNKSKKRKKVICYNIDQISFWECNKVRDCILIWQRKRRCLSWFFPVYVWRKSIANP